MAQQLRIQLQIRRLGVRVPPPLCHRRCRPSLTLRRARRSQRDPAKHFCAARWAPRTHGGHGRCHPGRRSLRPPGQANGVARSKRAVFMPGHKTEVGRRMRAELLQPAGQVLDGHTRDEPPPPHDKRAWHHYVPCAFPRKGKMRSAQGRSASEAGQILEPGVPGFVGVAWGSQIGLLSSFSAEGGEFFCLRVFLSRPSCFRGVFLGSPFRQRAPLSLPF